VFENLGIYYEQGFKMFPCRPNKSPAISKGENWKEDKNHLTQDKAETLQSTGNMIGAWIPEDIIVIDLDVHEGKANGINSFIEIKNKLDLNIELMKSTTVVKTGGGGFHIFFYAPKHGLKQGAIKVDGKEIGIDIKTNAGYVIAAGSPGYEYLTDAEPMLLPERLHDWLIGVKGEKTVIGKKVETDLFTVDYSGNKKGLITPKLLKTILNKLHVENFNTNDRWLEFITSAIAAAGDSLEVTELLESWSQSDPKYRDERNISNRINSLKKDGGITVGSFVHILKEEDISKYIISQVTKSEDITPLIEDSETTETDLPIPEPDYNELLKLPQIKEFFTTRGNTAAKLILFEALNNNVMYVKSEKEIYYFNESRWEILRDMFSIVYTIMNRVIKIYYASNASEGGKELIDAYKKAMQAINDTTWKSKTIKELNSMICEDVIIWDGPNIRETITTEDGVIEFKNKKIESRKGLKSEFRRSFIPYKTIDILEAEEPKTYLSFMKEIFPDPETCIMAEQMVSMCITGNSDKRLFQLWEGGGANGKTTLIELIKKILVGKTVTYDPRLILSDKSKTHQMGVTPELYSFMGAYAAVASEVDEGEEFSIGKIKLLTGGDTITANPKYRDQVNFEATWQLILSVNDLPRFNVNDKAFLDRLMILTFEMTYPKNEEERQKAINEGYDPKYIGVRKSRNDLIADIVKERNGVIKNMIETYITLETEHKGVIQESPRSKHKKRSYTQDNDDFGKFVLDQCIIGLEGFTTSEEITEAFKDYMGFKKMSSKYVISHLKKYNKNIIQTSKQVDILDHNGFMQKKRRRGLAGIRLKTNADFIKEDIDKKRRVDNLKEEHGYTDNIPF